MPQASWPIDLDATIQVLDAKHPAGAEAGALAYWAVWAVDGLFYLDDLDAMRQQKALPPTLQQIHHPERINVSHARWAVGSAITAIDLCAAVLGRRFLPTHKPGREYDVGAFQGKNAAKNIALLNPPAQAWVDAVQNDARFGLILKARHALTHRRLPRSIYLGGPGETDLKLDNNTAIPIRALVTQSRDLAAQHVAAFLPVIKAL